MLMWRGKGGGGERVVRGNWQSTLSFWVGCFNHHKSNRRQWKFLGKEWVIQHFPDQVKFSHCALELGSYFLIKESPLNLRLNHGKRLSVWKPRLATQGSLPLCYSLQQCCSASSVLSCSHASRKDILKCVFGGSVQHPTPRPKAGHTLETKGHPW